MRVFATIVCLALAVLVTVGAGEHRGVARGVAIRAVQIVVADQGEERVVIERRSSRIHTNASVVERYTVCTGSEWRARRVFDD